jgi:hypothetical protein
LSSVPSQADWTAIIAGSNVQFVIARASGGASASFPVPIGLRAQDILGSIPSGVNAPRAAYAELNYADSGPAQIQKALASIGSQKTSLTFLALAIEPLFAGEPFSNNNADVDGRNKIIYDSVQTVQTNGMKSIIYSRNETFGGLDYWHQITGDTSSFGCLPLWDSLPDQQVSLASSIADLPYGGWITRVGKQYNTGPNNLGVYLGDSKTPVDLDIFNPLAFNSGLSCSDNPSGCMAQDFASSVSVVRGGSRILNPTGTPKILQQPLMITNLTTTTIPGPISLVIDHLTNAKVANATSFPSYGVTTCTYPGNSMYVNVAPSLGPNQTVTAVMQYVLTGTQGPTFTTRVLGANGTR